MIDNFSLAVTHGLILLAFWRLLRRPDLDGDEATPPPRRGFLPAAVPPPKPGPRDA